MVKRFIAGAVCPACGAVDKIRAELGAQGLQLRECVACGFSDRISGQDADVPASRLERNVDAANKAQSAQEKPMRFFQPVAHHRKPE